MRLILIAAALAATPSLAQAQSGPTVTIEAATDDRRRGLSWSGGDPALEAAIGLPIGQVLRLDAGIATARRSPRHGGADATVDATLSAGIDLGAVRVEGSVSGYVFPGGVSNLGFVELGARAGWLIGPLSLDASARYAPRQSAIGGDNWRVGASARAGVIGTPYTVSADIARNWGTTTDPVRAARLRPAGAYTDWRLGVERALGPVTLGVDYVGTDVRQSRAVSPFTDARHSGDRIVGRVSIGF